MGNPRRATCQECGAHRDDVGELSWNGYCATCGPARAAQANAELHHHTGPTFTKWRHAMVACVGGVLLDELDTKA